MFFYSFQDSSSPADHLSEEKQEIQYELRKLAEAKQQLEKQMSEKNQQMSCFANEKTILCEELSTLKETIHQLNRTNRLLEEEKAELQRQINNFNDERISRQDNLSALNETVENYEKEREASVTNITLLAGKITRASY